MQPAAVALALALFLFVLVQGFAPPLLYAALLVPVLVLAYGLIAQDYPEEPFEREDAGEENGTTGSSGDDT